MFVRNATWLRIRDQFSEEEKAGLRAATCGESICPPAIHVDGNKLPPSLALKLRDAMTAVDPGA